jgi:hypothetical protein
MRSLLLLGAVLLGVALAESEELFYRYRVGALKSIIEDVEGKVTDLNNYWKAKFGPALVIPGDSSTKYSVIQQNLRADVARLEGAACPEGTYRCDSGDCIGNILVCDGSNDCPDGSDEDEHWCAIETPAGTVLEGGIWEEDGCTKRGPERIRVVVNYARAIPWMPNRILLGATVVVSFRKDGRLDTGNLFSSGSYNFATRELVLSPPDDDRIALACRFNGIRHDVCEGRFFRESSGETCGRFILKRLQFEQDFD